MLCENARSFAALGSTTATVKSSSPDGAEAPAAPAPAVIAATANPVAASPATHASAGVVVGGHDGSSLWLVVGGWS